MKISIRQEREAIVEAIVRDGRYPSADAVIDEGLRLLEERERKLQDRGEMTVRAYRRPARHARHRPKRASARHSPHAARKLHHPVPVSRRNSRDINIFHASRDIAKFYEAG